MWLTATILTCVEVCARAAVRPHSFYRRRRRRGRRWRLWRRLWLWRLPRWRSTGRNTGRRRRPRVAGNSWTPGRPRPPPPWCRRDHRSIRRASRTLPRVALSWWRDFFFLLSLSVVTGATERRNRYDENTLLRSRDERLTRVLYTVAG